LRKGNTQEKYPEFVQAGIGDPSIWDDVEAQSLLGRRRVCGGTSTPGDREATDSRDTEGSTIREAGEFGEIVFTEEPWQSRILAANDKQQK
jgi:hypothetical protein